MDGSAGSHPANCIEYANPDGKAGPFAMEDMGICPSWLQYPACDRLASSLLQQTGYQARLESSSREMRIPDGIDSDGANPNSDMDFGAISN